MTNPGEQQIGTAMKQAVQEPREPADLAVRARSRAARLRTRRRVLTTAAVAAVAAVVVVPATLLRPSGGAGPDPTGPGPTPSSGWSAFPACAGDGCDPDVVTDAIRRPLRLPEVGPGERCYTSPFRTLQDVAGFTGRVTTLGNGLLRIAGGPYPITTGRDAESGWYAQKVIWVFGREYGGPLLLRGGRIDGPGGLGFDQYLGADGYSGTGAGGGPHSRVLYVRGGLDAPATGTFGSRPGGIYVRRSGCYAIQVDGQGFSETLVFQVRVPPARQ